MVVIVGKISVPAAGTPIRVTDTAEYQAALVELGLNAQFKTCQAILFQSWQGNTGKVYIGKAGLNKTTGANVGQVLVAPSTSSIPSFGASIMEAPAGIDASAFFLDVDTNGEGPLVTLLIA